MKIVTLAISFIPKRESEFHSAMMYPTASVGLTVSLILFLFSSLLCEFLLSFTEFLTEETGFLSAEISILYCGYKIDTDAQSPYFIWFFTFSDLI